MTWKNEKQNSENKSIVAENRILMSVFDNIFNFFLLSVK